MAHQCSVIRRLYPNELAHFGVFLLQRRGQRGRRSGECIGAMLITLRRDYAVNVPSPPMKTVVTELVSNVQQHERTARHANAQSRDIDERVSLVPQQVSQCDFEVAFKQDFLLCRKVKSEGR